MLSFHKTYVAEIDATMLKHALKPTGIGNIYIYIYYIKFCMRIMTLI